MSFTYDLSTNTGKVRAIVGDTASATANFTDEEIAYFYSIEQSVNGAAALCLESLAARSATTAKSEQIGDYRYDNTSAASKYLELAKALRTKEAQTPSFAVGEMVTDGTNYVIY